MTPNTDAPSKKPKLPIALDAVGGDHAPSEVIQGAVQAHRESGVPITLVGPRDLLLDELTRMDAGDCPIELVDAPLSIAMDEAPVQAVRHKRDSSIVVGMDLVKKGRASGFVSAGNSGAIMAASVLRLGRSAEIDKPALASVFPTIAGECLILDVGASTDCRVDDLLRFAVMGSVYCQRVMMMPNPKVGLLSNGEESSKGNAIVQQTHARLASSSLNFVGNIEGKDIPFGKADVIVADGFVGNVALKTAEGVAEFAFKLLRDEFERASLLSKIGGLLLMPSLRRIKRRFDYDEYGAALLLGVDGIVLIAHGRSKAKAIKNSLLRAYNAVEFGVVNHIRVGSDQMVRSNSIPVSG
jgi:glycerol-3-phosphate acyltransferase PlsX